MKLEIYNEENNQKIIELGLGLESSLSTSLLYHALLINVCLSEVSISADGSNILKEIFFLSQDLKRIPKPNPLNNSLA